MKNDKDVIALFQKQKKVGKRGLSAQYENTETCWSFYNADQMTYSDTIQFADTWGTKRRALVNFNKVQQNVDAVVGFMAQNRREARYIARLNSSEGQQLYSKNMNAIYEFHRESMNADQLESEQDLDMMVNGYGVVDTELSYVIGNSTTAPNGEIVKAKLDPSCVYWDPAAQRQNIADAMWIGYWRDIELKDALDLFQGSDQSDFEQVSEDDSSDSGYVFNPYGGIYDKIKMMDSVEWTSKESEMVRVYNHQWKEFETFYKSNNPLYEAQTPEDAMFFKMRLDAIKENIKPVGDTKTEDMFEFDPTAETLVFDEPTKRALVRDFGDLITPVPFKRAVFYTAVISGSHVFTWFKSVCQQGFSIKVKTGTWNRQAKMWMGMVNPMMEPQNYYNKALTELMFTIAANSKGGVMVEEDAVEDIADFESKWSKTDAVVVVNSGAIAQGKILEKTRGALPTGLEGVLQLCDANIAANGVDPSFLGNLEREDQSGILYKRRIRQVISKMARYFDSITLYQKEDARLCADLIRVWVDNNLGVIVRIIGDDGADEFVQITQDMLAPEYDVSIQEASQAPEEQQETAMLLSSISDKLLSVGDQAAGKAFLSEAMQYMRMLDGDTRNRLIQVLQPQDSQINPMMVQALQAENEQLKQIIQSRELEKTESEIVKNVASAQKTMKDVEVSNATIEKIVAETVKTLEEAQRTNIEAEKAAAMPVKEMSINL